MRIISRAEWGARAPRSITRTTWAKRIGFAIHYSDGSPTTGPKGLQNYAMDSLGYVDTHYNFFVDRDGNIFEGRGWLVVAAHAKDQNTPWVGACFIGRNGDITDKAKAAMRWLYEEANRRKGSRLLISGHGQLPGQSTDCPGSNWKTWIKAGMPAPTLTEDDVWCKKGDKGDNVTAMQMDVVDAGGKVGPKGTPTAPYADCDGDYGDNTAAGVKSLTGGTGEVYGPGQRRRVQEILRQKAASPIPSKITFTLPAQSITASVTPAS